MKKDKKEEREIWGREEVVTLCTSEFEAIFFSLSLSQNMIQTWLENRIELNLPWLWTIRMASNENNNQQSPASQFQITVNNTRLTITVFALSQNNMANGIWTSARQNCPTPTPPPPPPPPMPKELTILALTEPATHTHAHTHTTEYKLLSWVDKTASLRPLLQGEALNCLKVSRRKNNPAPLVSVTGDCFMKQMKNEGNNSFTCSVSDSRLLQTRTHTASTHMVMVTVVVLVVVLV